MDRDQMEDRRLSAGREILAGVSLSEIERKHGVSYTTACRWKQIAINGGGIDALRKRRAAGRPCRMSDGQRIRLKELYAAGPRAAGLEINRWTTLNLSVVILKEFGIKYDRDHVGRIMHKLGLRGAMRKKKKKAADAVFSSLPAESGFIAKPVEIQA